MSILLDALKRSETQRQLGKTPTIHTAVEASENKRETEQQWIPLSMLALSAVAIAWFGWQQFREPVAALDEAGSDIVAIPQAEQSPAVENQLAADSPEEAQERREKLSQSFNSYEAEKDTATDQGAKPSPVAAAKTSSDPTLVRAATLRAATNQSAVEEAPVATPDKSSSRLQPHEPEPISFWQIPQELREGLPEFRINVLVYAENPEDRFLLINGERLVEKQELVEGVVLEEIQRDGAVFRYRNYRFLVKG